MSPNAGPGERKYPDEELRAVRISQPAKQLAADLHNEAQTDRIYAIIQLALDDYSKGTRVEYVVDPDDVPEFEKGRWV